MAILNSTPADGGSRPIWAMPPKIKRVMLRIGMAFRSATHEWPSSCTSTEPKKRRLVTAPTSRYVASPQPGYFSGK